MNRITVVVVEDKELVRDGLASVLDRETDIDVVGTAATAEQAMPLLRKLAPWSSSRTRWRRASWCGP